MDDRDRKNQSRQNGCPRNIGQRFITVTPGSMTRIHTNACQDQLHEYMNAMIIRIVAAVTGIFSLRRV